MIKQLFQFIIASTSAFELIKVEKGIGKEGLHRDLITNFTWRVDSKDEFDNCGLVFIENVTKDTYIYLEEVKGLKDFEFWPHYPIDIEKPASVSIDHQFIWRANLKQAVAVNDFVYHVEGTISDTYPQEITTSVKYEYHLRYQPVGPGKEYTNVSFGGDTRVKLSCDLSTNLFFFSDNFLAKRTNEVLLTSQDPFGPDILAVKPTPITVLVPTGDSDKLEEIQRNTIGLTIFGMLFLLYEIYRKSQYDSVQVNSKF